MTACCYTFFQMKRNIDLIVLLIIILFVILAFFGSYLPKTYDSTSKTEQYPAVQYQDKTEKDMPIGGRSAVPGVRVPKRNK